MKLDPRQCEAMLAVIDTGSFDQAARRLHLTPSAISQRLRALESRLGSPLVVRTRPCRATPAGQRLLQHLRQAQLLDEDLDAEFAGDAAKPLSLAIAVNADSLATWFLPALAGFMIEENVLLDVTVDDQDHTYALLQAGLALGCVSSEPRPMRGCVVESLGRMRYRAMAATGFRDRWFAQGANRTSFRAAPAVVFNRKDSLQADFLLKHFGLPPDAYPCHYVPASHAYVRAVELGTGWGMIPELQSADLLSRQLLVELAPAHPVDVALYWHRWKVQSPRLERLSRRLIQGAGQYLGVDSIEGRAQ